MCWQEILREILQELCQQLLHADWERQWHTQLARAPCSDAALIGAPAGLHAVTATLTRACCVLLLYSMQDVISPLKVLLSRRPTRRVSALVCWAVEFTILAAMARTCGVDMAATPAGVILPPPSPSHISRRSHTSESNAAAEEMEVQGTTAADVAVTCLG